MDAIHSTREKILQIAGERDKTLHALSTVADTKNIQAALVALPTSLPEKGLGPTEAIDVVLRDVIPGLAPGHAGPRMSAETDQLDESISAVIESRALEFVLDLFHLPREKFPARVLTSGGTASNVLGLALARDYAVRKALGSPTYSVAEDGFGGATVKVYSDRPHASLIKASGIVGLGKSNVVDIGRKSGASGVVGIDLEELEKYLKEAAPGSGIGAVVSLSFGEISTGDFTPNVREIRKLCSQYDVWLHIDAAFGAYARLVPDITGSISDGLELADSIASDGHKWLNVPYDCGIFFSRSIEHQSSVFGPSLSKAPPAYLARATGPWDEALTPEMKAAKAIPDAMNMTIENSRRFRALPLYTALLDQGREGYADLVRRNILFTRQIAAWMASPEGKGYYEVLNLRQSWVDSSAPPTTPLNMLLFRASAGNPVQAYCEPGGSATLVRALNETRKIQVTPGLGAVRIAVSNWCTGLQTVNENGMEKGDMDIVAETLLAVVEHPPTWISQL
ncbi:hypothetical protein BU17DRAFT_67449 [Hysterangium stoloniferum]|nr:hypothetical protein BU17DRAFT_67449 [Hysterangium stoloniferum]